MQSDGSIHVLVLHLELHIPQSQSLKAKRKVVKSLRERLKHRFNASVAEVGYMEKWQRAQLALAVTGPDHRYLEQQCQKMLGFVESEIIGEAMITAWEVEER
jgi:uncharacterized protein YlxP (DUF503 family)